jgi:hypothetical protein
MYEEFLKLSCQGEKELNDQYNHDIRIQQQKMQSQHARLQGPQVIKQKQECTGVKINVPFCGRPIENERIPRGRDTNGNLQKMFLLSTKNTNVNACGIIGWSDAESISEATSRKTTPVWASCSEDL